MRTDHHLDPDENALAQMGYETEDIEYRGLGKSLVWFFGFVAFCGVAGLLVFGAFIGFDNLANPPEITAPFVNRTPAKPNPLLQTNVTARTDIRDLRREENLLLHGNATWADKEKGAVRIPIERAVDLYLQRSGGDSSAPTSIASGAPPVAKTPPEAHE
jgi:hypothetical protein